MGFIDFVKSAGEKIGLDLGADEKQAGEKKPQAQTTVDPAKLDRRRAAALASRVGGLGFEVEELGVRVDGDQATVTGIAGSQEEREKVVLTVGNTAGIARVDDRMKVRVEEPAAALYTVVAGDTLSKIARDHYGNANEYGAIFEANRPMLTDPDEIYPGQVLRIPRID